MQSQILVWIIGPVLLLLCLCDFGFQYWTFHLARGLVGTPIRPLAVGLLFALVAWKLGSATRPAAACGSMACYLLATSMDFGLWPITHPPFPILRSGLSPLIALFLVTFACTRAGRARKRMLGVSEDKKGRNAAQVLANLATAAMAASFPGYYLAQASGLTGQAVYDAMPVMALAALTEATADTVSSEIGQAFGGRPILLATLKRVEQGTDGAVTLLGTLAGIAGGALVAAIGTATLGIGTAGFLVALAAGTAGLFFDSFLGATIERRGWLGNDWVNFTSTVFAALVALALPVFRWHGIA